MQMDIRENEMELNKWKATGDCCDTQYYFESFINRNTIMEICVPQSWNNYKEPGGLQPEHILRIANILKE